MTAPKSCIAGRAFLFFIIGLLIFNPVKAQNKAKADKPNIILIFADDLGYMDVGYTSGDLGLKGADYYETPNIDKLATEGMRFTNAYAGAANCAPSRGCLLSGQYTPRHGIFAVGSTAKGPVNLMRLAPVPNTTYLDPSVFTMAEALKSGGYATGHFGKWHVGSENNKTDPGSQGFDVSSDAYETGTNKKQNVSTDPKGVFGITQAACDFITANKDKPFFAYVSHHAVHGPHQARAKSLAKFKGKKPGKYHDDALFAACIYDFDESVGQLLAHLRKLGLDKNTLVIFTSDNGGTPNSPQEPLRGNKGSFYEGGIREAFIARWPGHIKSGTVNAAPIINLDLYPTFAVAAKVKLPADKVLDGENLLPLFTGQQTKTSRDKIFWHFPGYLENGTVIRGRDTIWRTQPVTVMRKGDFKIMLYHEEWVLDGGWNKRATNNAVEVYNLKTDIGEHNNIAASNPKKRDEMLTDLLAWMKETKAPMATIKTPQQEKRMSQTQVTGKKGKKKNNGNGNEDED